MNGLVLLLLAAVLFVGAYKIYGGWLAKKWGVDDKRETPAHTLRDDIDYCPADARVVFGHQFSSIAGAGPITGPIAAIGLGFGWLPAYIWIVLGSMFLGGVHDWGSLFASVRHEGKSIGEIIRANVGDRAKLLFNIFAWLALTLVVAAFTDICAGTFAYDPANPEALTGARAGTASLLFIVLAMLFGFFVYRKKANLMLSTIIGVALLFVAIWVGYAFPVVKLSKLAWDVVLIVYISAASIMPVWILLQPRDYLCSFLLYAMLIGAFLGIILVQPVIKEPAYTGFVNMNGQSLFPILFITIACGAVSGFHSLVSSGTASKQVSKESDTKIIGYGAMLIEGIIAVIAILAVCYVAKEDRTGTPAQIFASGVANFMNHGFGFPVEVGQVFVILAFSAFALTSLDTATRLGRYMWQEMFQKVGVAKEDQPFLAKNITATIITVGASVVLLLYGFKNIWPVFGAANQLLAAMAFLGLTTWFYKTKKPVLVAAIPMCFMLVVTLVALAQLTMAKFNSGDILLSLIAGVLFILAVVLVFTAFTEMRKDEKTS